MDERAALRMLSGALSHAGDDAAVVEDLLVTTDMLHETTDFPEGTTRYTAGWRAVGASLSDVAAMGGAATAAVAVYAAPAFEDEQLRKFVAGASEVCEAVDGAYVGGDLDTHEEFTVATTVVGRAADPVYRSGARPGEAVCVTGSLGRSAAALELFHDGEYTRANDLFRFEPRVGAGRALASHASSMMDSSDGLARSLHQLAEASDCGFAIESGVVPVAGALREVVEDPFERGVFFGEDFELVFTLPKTAVSTVEGSSPTPITVIGEVTEGGVEMDGNALADRGYTHG
ncbi:thiamine-phosphate kinase [Halalkalicoccus jeotgali]|uniref:Thiamine-monophosphate kinase n=1 Tax=Halalkalicoccus jeotgali (strain DSM 18796 / CECT 7217 / JCM 14584 / KCTC 4019 / B3) TaxID=795797 RepID=D8J8R2_HALJB|nr:thiamine-phosphate kinase [Halalkalicoccus jeotgali]ADJ14247.1 thiamine-monophosphate kinase [Halalkalicoccus jeotgali B3]ELY40509.1 thiamine-monophosphate kinase [Halalkalicoccus jeotgali B3]